MTKFKNVRTGNILEVSDEGTIALMRGSENYEEIKQKPKQQQKGGKDETPDTTPPAE